MEIPSDLGCGYLQVFLQITDHIQQNNGETGHFCICLFVLRESLPIMTLNAGRPLFLPASTSAKALSQKQL